MQRREGAYLQVLALPSHFWLLFLASCFYHFLSSTFSLASSSSQIEEKKKKNTKKKKTIEKKKNEEKGGSLPSSFRFTLSLLALAFGSCFYPFVSSAFSLAFSSFQVEEKKKKTQRKKNHREKKNAEKGGSLPFFFHFYISDEALLLLSPLHIPSSSLVSHVSSKLCATQAQELSRALEME
jgi:hypothetical protein